MNAAQRSLEAKAPQISDYHQHLGEIIKWGTAYSEEDTVPSPNFQGMAINQLLKNIAEIYLAGTTV